eukprot:COSAG06_NODE_703_length_12909_cov_33.909758_6_plen_70_part_00
MGGQSSPSTPAREPDPRGGTDVRLYECVMGTGFRGTFAEVEQHERRIVSVPRPNSAPVTTPPLALKEFF